MKKNVKNAKNNYGEKYTKVGIIIQALFLLGLLVTFIISLFNKDYFYLTELLSALLLGIMAFNNLYKKVDKKLGITYLICSIVILIVFIVTIIFGK